MEGKKKTTATVAAAAKRLMILRGVVFLTGCRNNVSEALRL